MTITDLHLRAAISVPFRVCGVVLLPMQVGHGRILEGLGLMRAYTPDQIMAAAWICSRPWQKFSGSIDHWTTKAWFRFWRHRLGGNWDWAKSAEVWFRYVEHNLDEPMATSKGKGDPLRTPWLAHLRSVCCGECGYNPDTFNDARIDQATIDYHAYAERMGYATLMNATVSQMRELQGQPC